MHRYARRSALAAAALALSLAGLLLASAAQSQSAVVHVAAARSQGHAAVPHRIGPDAAKNTCVLDTDSNLVMELPPLARYR
jgi:hypothetical protein